MCLQYCEQDKSCFLINETVPLVFLVSEDVGTDGNNYDHSVLRTVFHSAFPTLLSTCLHIPLSSFLSLPLSSFSLSEDGECWSVGVSSSFGLFLLRDLLYLVEKLFICTLQIQYRLIYFHEWGFTAGRDVGRSIFGTFVCVCVLLCWSHTPYNLLLGSFLFSCLSLCFNVCGHRGLSSDTV